MAPQVRVEPKTISDEDDPDFVKHLHALGLGSAAQYREWCQQNGFSRRIKKHWRERCKERSFANQAWDKARLAQKKSECRKPGRAIEDIFCGELAADWTTEPYLQAVCAAYKSVSHGSRTADVLRRVFLHVAKYADLLATTTVVPEYGRHEANTFIGGLLALARASSAWIRPVEDWKPRTYSPRRQFAALARHLLCLWPIPSFMDAVWFNGAAREGARQQSWFSHMGQGKSIRTADLPLTYTKRMAGHFMRAPSDLTVERALRWGQILGLGGNERLARAVLGTRLAARFDHDEFWVTVLRFLIEHPSLDSTHVAPIIDFIEFQKFAADNDAVAAAGAPGVPLQTEFTMKGRTVVSLLRQVDAWHRTLAEIKRPQAEWASSGIYEFRFVEGTEGSDGRKSGRSPSCWTRNRCWLRGGR